MSAVEASRSPSPLDQPVADIARFDLVTVAPNETLRTVAIRMHREGVSALVVDGDGDEFGIVTEADLIAAIAKEADVDEVWSADIMTRDVQAVPAADPIADVAELMLVGRIRHVVVQGESDRLGIVSIRDLLDPLLSVEDHASP